MGVVFEKQEQALKKNRENGARLAASGIRPLPCQSECCDAAEGSNYPRSQLYFDGQVTDIDYDKLKEMLFGPPPPSTTDDIDNVSAAVGGSKRRMEEEESPTQTDHGIERAPKMQKKWPGSDSPTPSSVCGSAISIPGHADSNMTVSSTVDSAQSSALTALCEDYKEEDVEDDHRTVSDPQQHEYAPVQISDIQLLPPFPSPVAYDDELSASTMFALSPVVEEETEVHQTNSDMEQQENVEDQLWHIPFATADNTDQQRTLPEHRGDGMLSLLIRWVYALFTIIMTAFYHTSNVRSP